MFILFCEICHEKEATIHFSEIKNGMKKEMHLCENCAQKKQDINFDNNFNIPFSIQDIFSSIMNADIDNVFSRKSEQACPKCGSTYNRFRNTGKFGCEKCYEVFHEQVYPLVKRVQGTLDHTGKIPKRAAGPIRVRKELQKFKRQLAIAVDKEDFERAVELRDKIKELEKEINN